jgi:predicted DsbA family dithiol-disulfide isomerase
VMGVPKTIINERVSVDGAMPEDPFVQQVLGAAGKA